MGCGNGTLVAVVRGVLAWVLLKQVHDGSRVERMMKRFPSGDSTENLAHRQSTTSSVMWEPRISVKYDLPSQNPTSVAGCSSVLFSSKVHITTSWAPVRKSPTG